MFRFKSDRRLLRDVHPQVEADFVQRLVAERRDGRRLRAERDLLDILLQAQAAGGLSERELADLLIFLFVAGFDTSKNVLTLAMYELLARPEVYARCAEDVGYARKVVDETMRFHSVTTTNRLLTEELVYRDVALPKDTSLWFPWAMLGRDPAAAEDPDRFDPDRPKRNPHMGFALGAHICLGQFIARHKVHIVAMTGSYFRGDAEAVLAPQDEAKFDDVT